MNEIELKLPQSLIEVPKGEAREWFFRGFLATCQGFNGETHPDPVTNSDIEECFSQCWDAARNSSQYQLEVGHRFFARRVVPGFRPDTQWEITSIRLAAYGARYEAMRVCYSSEEASAGRAEFLAEAREFVLTDILPVE